MLERSRQKLPPRVEAHALPDRGESLRVSPGADLDRSDLRGRAPG